MPTDTPWCDATRALWERIRSHALFARSPGLDFTTRLARENGWTAPQAAAVVEEYRRYCFLACVAGRAMSPGDAVDQAWHLHLTYSRDYWDAFCAHVLRVPLHHEPTRGGPADAARHRAQYADTLAEYERWFGAPPEAWWPSTHEQFRAPSRWRRVDTQRVVVWPRPSLRRALAALAALLAAPAAHAAALNPFDWSGGAFIALYVVLAIATIPASLIVRRVARSTSAAPGYALGPYDLAYLGGGTSRVADTAVAELFSSGAARWDPSGKRLLVERLPSDASTYARAAATAAAASSEPGTLARALESATAPLRQNLERRRYVLDADGSRRVRLAAATLPALLVAFGAAKIAIGVTRDRPVAFLVILTALVAVFGLVMYFRTQFRTSAGDSALANAKREHARATRAPRDLDLPIAVALLGSAAFAGTAFAGWHEHRLPQQTGDAGTSSDGGSSYSGDSSSGSDSSDSSDSGGGDSGGSGCGGCGGGGGD